MKMYRDMSPADRALSDWVLDESMDMMKLNAEIRMAEYDSLPQWERDLMKEDR